ncbi:carnitine O-acetyltransferase-like [Gigantopelta aegis]|uniref:carnitine O-acetyltransferase-like n=1 Tax=Gigantopelta aegis TaxID=1735272 RepID=UPI001B88C2FD|nr:carnitine O-acetyltransferase-like [Gigantopelta aegis]
MTMSLLIKNTLSPRAGKVLVGMSSKMRRPSGRMFSIQDSLPRLPVPQLDVTLQKYLRCITPLCTAEEFKKTQKIVEEFRRDPGPKLQQLLEQRAQKNINWLSDWWKNLAYLEVRSPVPINSNPGVIFPRQNYSGTDSMITYAAKIVSGALDYKKMIDSGDLPVEQLGGKPLCMMQYYQILNGCRIPGEKIDSHVCFPPTSENPPRHIIVIHNNQFFSLDVHSSDGKLLNEDQLRNQLKNIVNQSQQVAPALGILTMWDRPSWAKTYNKIIQDKHNKKLMEDIQRSIFVLCLDKSRPDLSQEEARIFAAEQMLHGGGSQLNSANRWFDKTLQFMIGSEGTSGLNYEHTTAEGPPIAAMMDHILTYCEKNTGPSSPAGGMSDARKLDFTLNNDILDDIEKAKEATEKFIHSVSVRVFTYSGYGKNFPKTQKLSPDAYIQTALQLAYFRLYGKTCATYESASLRRFQLGRTDTIRSCSIDSLNFTRAMDDSSLTNSVKADLFRQAVLAHRKYTDETINGRGIDRHLLGLKLSALEANLDVPELHKDPSYSQAFHFKLSTSQVATHHEGVMVFGPVVPDGYGLCYNPQETKIHFGVSTYTSCPDTDSNKLGVALMKSFDDLRDLLASTPQAKL